MSAVVPFYIKTAYHDEPSFTNTKVVSSLFANSMNSPLDPNFKRCLEFRDATAELLKPYKDQFDFDELSKLAIDYSDGVVAAVEGVNKDLLDYASEKNIPVLNYSKDNLGENTEAFYNTICPSISEESEDE
jgi:starch synthase